MSHHSHVVSSHSHTRSSLSHSQSHRSHSLSHNSHPNFPYSHAPFSKPGPGSCAHSERSHASSYGPPGLPPPYCLARLAHKTSVSSSTPPGAPPGRKLAAVPPELTASRQSFQHAMGNPCEFFVDIMWQDSAFKTHRAQNNSPCTFSAPHLFPLNLSSRTVSEVQNVDSDWPHPFLYTSVQAEEHGQREHNRRESSHYSRAVCGWKPFFVLTWRVQFVKREWY